MATDLPLLPLAADMAATQRDLRTMAHEARDRGTRGSRYSVSLPRLAMLLVGSGAAVLDGALAAAASEHNAAQGLSCEDDALGRCADWLAPGLSRTEADSACAAAPGLLKLHCPQTCGTCAEHAAYLMCGGGSSTPADQTSGKQVVRTSPAELGALMMDVAARAEALFPGQTRWLRAPAVLGPSVLQIDGFLSPDEARQLVEHAEATGFHSSSRFIDGEKGKRTSSSTFCRAAASGDGAGCAWLRVAALLSEKAAQVLAVPSSHFEDIQFVRYNTGEQYVEHNDFIPEDLDTSPGPRLLTFFVYLTSIPEGGGGETEFSELGLKVIPVVGRAVIWTNVFAFKGGSSGRLRWLPDGKALHAARPVGVNTTSTNPKYVANLWVHNGDYQFHHHYRRRCADLRGKAALTGDVLEL